MLFDYQTSRADSHARAFLGDWKGNLMVDDYVGYKARFWLAVTGLGGLAHARRKFFELPDCRASAHAHSRTVCAGSPGA